MGKWFSYLHIMENPVLWLTDNRLSGALLVWMIVILGQQFWIYYGCGNAHGSDWDKQAKHIRRHMQWTVLSAWVLLLVGPFVVFFFEAQNGVSAPLEAYRHLWQPGNVRNLLPALAMLLVLGLMRAGFEQVLENGASRDFLGGFIKVFFGGAVWDSKPTRVSALPQPPRDLWIFVFTLMLVAEIAGKSWEINRMQSSNEENAPVVAIAPPPAAPAPAAVLAGGPVGVASTLARGASGSAILAAFGTHFLIGLSWIGWVYSALFRKLVEEFKFSPAAARKHIAGWRASEPLQQVLLIGSFQGGKTEFAQAGFGEEQKEAFPAEVGTGAGTQEMWLYPRQGQGGRVPVRLSVLDTPGEHMGAQLSAVSNWRADVVIYVIAEDGFDLERFESLPASQQLAGFSKCFDPPQSKSDVQGHWITPNPGLAKNNISETKNFYDALRRCLQQGAAAHDAIAAELYNVGAFVLFFNSRRQKQDQLEPLNPDIDQSMALDCLAIEIGRRLGVKNERSFAISGNARNVQRGLFLLSQIDYYVKKRKKSREADGQRSTI